MKNGLATLDTGVVQSRLMELRGQRVLLDRDVAALYGVQTREINQAIRNNPDKFPEGYVFETAVPNRPKSFRRPGTSSPR